VGFEPTSSSLAFQTFPQVLERDVAFAFVLHFRIPISRLSSDSVSPGTILVKWHRKDETQEVNLNDEITQSQEASSSDPLSPPPPTSTSTRTTSAIFPLQPLQPHSIGLVAILQTPPSCKLHVPAPCYLTIYNADPSQSVELDFQMDPSSSGPFTGTTAGTGTSGTGLRAGITTSECAFLTSGLHYAQLPLLLPESYITLEFAIVPMIVGMGALPKIQVWRRTGSGQDTNARDTSNRALIPVVWANESVGAGTGGPSSTMRLKVVG